MTDHSPALPKTKGWRFSRKWRRHIDTLRADIQHQLWNTQCLELWFAEWSQIIHDHGITGSDIMHLTRDDITDYEINDADRFYHRLIELRDHITRPLADLLWYNDEEKQSDEYYWYEAQMLLKA